METKIKGIPYWQKIVIVLCLGWVAIWIYRSWLSPIYPEIQATVGELTSAQLGLIASCYFFAYTGMQIPSGIIVDKLGKKAVLIPGFLLFALAAVIVGSAKSIEMIYLGSVLAGLGTGAYYGAAYSLTATYIPDKNRTFATAIINSGSAVGMAIGLIGSSYLIKVANIPWSITLYLIAGIILAMVATFFIFIKNDKDVKDVANKVDAKAEEKTEIKQKVKLFSPRLITAYILYFVTCYGYYMMVTWLPNFLEAERGFVGTAIGMSSSLVAFASIPGALFFSRRSDKYRNRKVSLIFFLEISAAVMLALIVLAPSSNILLIGLILYGFLGKMAVDPILISYIVDSADKSSLGTSLGTFNFFGMSSSVVAPALTGFISDTTGSKVLGFYLSVIMLVVGTLLFYFVNKTTKQKQQIDAETAK